jgi:hypothetical protein
LKKSIEINILKIGTVMAFHYFETFDVSANR